MKYYIIAGEASGDLHGSRLIKELKLLDTNATINCWGGDLMEAAGGNLIKHYRQLAFMGFIEVIKNLPTIIKNIKFCKQDILSFNPDVLVLIDYPGFNLRIAEWAKQQKIKVVYYISPQVWAWKANRVIKMKQCIDKMLVILPFEKDYYKKEWNWDVEYVGHPLVEAVEEKQVGMGDDILRQAQDDKGIGKPIIAVLPGSRKQEINIMLPIMLKVADRFPQCHFIIAKAPGQDDEFYEPYLNAHKNVSSVRNDTYTLLTKANAALVTSGTATLETALFNVPEVVCYKGSAISYFIAKKLIKIKYISLVNLIMDKLVVTELIQHEMNADNLAKELNALLFNEERKEQLQKDYTALKTLLSAGGKASAKAARFIVDELN